MIRSKICGIYKIINKINNKVYIGQSIDINKRWLSEKRGKSNSYLGRSIKKYGLNNFNFEILKECKQEDLNDLECFFIRVYCSWNSKYGYNMTLGGSPGVPTEETKQKVRNGLLGHICKEETRQKLKIANLGKRHSKESIKKMKEIHKGQKAYNKGLYDISYYNSKPIICITTGEIFPSKKEVRRLKSISKSVLDRILLGNILEKDKLIYKYYLGEK